MDFYEDESHLHFGSLVEEVQKEGTKITTWCFIQHNLATFIAPLKTAKRQYSWSLFASGMWIKIAVLGTWSCAGVCSVIHILHA